MISPVCMSHMWLLAMNYLDVVEKLLVPRYADPTQYFLQLDAIALEHQHQLTLSR